MSTKTEDKPKTRVANAITLGKEFVSLLRDGALLCLVVLLVVFPKQFNSILTNAGFVKGSVLGFDWENPLIDTNESLKNTLDQNIILSNTIEVLRKELNEGKKRLDDSALTERWAKLESESQALEKENKKVQTAGLKTIDSNIPLLEKALSSSSQVKPYKKSDYLVGLQTVGILESERLAINEKLSSDGYGLDIQTYSYPAGDRPYWFAYKSTVFFYSPKSRQSAQELARYLKTVTGQEFAVQRGAGLGVQDDRMETTFFVHYVKN